jgi:zinc protease
MSPSRTSNIGRLAAVWILGLLGAAGAAQTEIPGAERIVERTLDNGLKIIVWPDEDIPNVAWYHYVRAGARNEYPGITGISHFFEHLMFKASEGLPPGEFDRIMEAAGGVNNAYTNSDVTVYTDWFPRSALETIFRLESDRFARLEFVPELVESERGVVTSERRSSTDDQNQWFLAEQVQATAFAAHPYQNPVIGWPSDIAAWTIDDLKRYHRTYYAPNNTTLVIVGDVDPDEVFAYAEQYFGPTPAQEPPPPVRTVEPPQTGQRRVEVQRAGQTPYLQVAFHSTAKREPDTLALRMLMDILATGESSRLYRRLIDQDQSAVALRGVVDAEFDPGLTWILLTLPADGDTAAVEAALFEELAGIAADGVTVEELAKVRNIRLADFWRTLATIDGKADLLGDHEVFHGDWRDALTLADRIEAVTPEQIQRIAGDIFRVENSTVGVVVPMASSEAVGDADSEEKETGS